MIVEIWLRGGKTPCVASTPTSSGGRGIPSPADVESSKGSWRRYTELSKGDGDDLGLALLHEPGVYPRLDHADEAGEDHQAPQYEDQVEAGLEGRVFEQCQVLHEYDERPDEEVHDDVKALQDARIHRHIT